MPELVVPLVHLNGTSKQALCEALGEVYVKLEDAAVQLRQAAPNLRDYYPLCAEKWDAAQAQHMRRLKTIRDLQQEIGAEISAIEEQRR